jgi:predicted dehydrogenase
MHSPLRIGIVGTGFIADVIATAMKETSAVRLSAVASRRVETASAFAARHDCVPVHGTWEELLASGDVDAVYVATPTVAREAICVEAAKRGKHVLGDKPFRDLASLRNITAACREAGVAFMDATHFTHHPRTRQIRAELPERTGRLESIRTSFFFPNADKANIRLQPDKEPTGAIGDMAWYSMRAVAEYAPHHPAVVCSRGVARRDTSNGAFLRGAGVIGFADGLTTTWDAGYTVGACLMDLDLMGEKGVIQVDDFVLDWAGGYFLPDHSRVVGFTQRNGPVSPSGYVRVESPSPVRQAALMMEEFARLARDPRSPDVEASIRRTEYTQHLVDTIFASLEVGA